MDLIERAKRFAGDYKKDVEGLATTNPQSLKMVRKRQGEGFFQADIGEDGKANEPASGPYEHNSPAKPL